MNEWLTVEEAADRLQVSIRQANRYGNRSGNGDEPELRTQKAGKRTLYLREDVEALADKLGVAYKPRPPHESTALVQPSELLDYVRERDQRVEQMTQQLMAASHRIGELETLLQQRLLPEDAEELRKHVVALEVERDFLRAQIKQPWWKRLLGLG